MKPAISALACHVPERIVTNDELAGRVETSDEWIYSHTGIRERRYAAEGQSASDLGVIAARAAIEQRGIGPDQIDLVICATSTPDFVPFPATACIIQDRLGLTGAAAFDLQAGCTGFAYGLEVARSLVEAGGAARVLLVGAEVLTSITNWEDRGTCILFGDGAGAVIVENAESGEPTPGGHAIRASWLRSKGSGDSALMRAVGGSRTPFIDGTHQAADLLLAMNGKQVYLFAVDAIVQSINALCERGGVSLSQIDWIVPHQANARIIEAAAKRLHLPIERFFMNVDRYANTSAASIPIALDEMSRTGVLVKGQTVLTVGFGAGLTYGGNVLEW